MAQKQCTTSDRTLNIMARQCELYTETAKRLVVANLSLPSVEIVYVSLLIAMNEFAEDRDSGLWIWLGIALRMSLDLGLHKTIPDRDGDVEMFYGQNVFWSAICADRLISSGSGRLTTIADSIIEHVPDFRFVSASDGRRFPDPFPYYCRLMVLLGRVVDCLNSYAAIRGTRTESDSDVSNDANLIKQFHRFQTDVSEFYTSLPAELLFDISNFQEYVQLGQSQIFFQLHIWNQALILAVHYPSVVCPEVKINVTSQVPPNPRAEMTVTGAISIADMITLADIVDPMSFMASPHISQAIYLAARVVLSISQSLEAPSSLYPVVTLQRTYNTCRGTLARMQKVWTGILWVERTLESAAAQEPDVDLSVGCKGSVIARDLGIVRKALADESTKKWLAREISADSSDDVFGLLIAGAIDRSQMPLQPFDTSQTSSPSQAGPSCNPLRNTQSTLSSISLSGKSEPMDCGGDENGPAMLLSANASFRDILEGISVDDFLGITSRL
jgi:hypothetical protein